MDYADPGYQYDGRQRYPIDTPARVRNAWARIHQRLNAMRYTPYELGRIEAAIRARARAQGIFLTEHGSPLHRYAVGAPRTRPPALLGRTASTRARRRGSR